MSESGPKLYYPDEHVALEFFFTPPRDPFIESMTEPLFRGAPPAFVHLAKAFEKNCSAVACTATLPFRMASSNVSHGLYHDMFLSERIRTLKPEFNKLSEDEKLQIAHKAARETFQAMMGSEDGRDRASRSILATLGQLLEDPEVKLAALELMRQSDALLWGILEVFANDVFVLLLNEKPHFTEVLFSDEKAKKRFQLKDLIPQLSSYGYDLSNHMGDVLHEWIRIDDATSLRTVYEALFPSDASLMKLIRIDDLWKLNQRRNLILHRRGIVDQSYLKNTGENVALGSEIVVSPDQFFKDLLLILDVGIFLMRALPR